MVGLFDAVFCEDGCYLWDDGACPQGVAVVAGVDAVDRRFVVVAGGIGVDEVHIFVLRHGFGHHLFGHGFLLGFALGAGSVEGAVFAVDGLLEDERFAWVRLLDALDEGEEALLDEFGRGVGEAVEDEGIGVDIGERFGKVGLEHAVAAASQA